LTPLAQLVSLFVFLRLELCNRSEETLRTGFCQS
jgi:hypothetical protein